MCQKIEKPSHFNNLIQQACDRICRTIQWPSAGSVSISLFVHTMLEDLIWCVYNLYASLNVWLFLGFDLVRCEEPGVPNYGYKIQDDGHYANTFVLYSCNPGYSLHGSSTLTCLSGDRRVWDRPLPSCIGKSDSAYIGFTVYTSIIQYSMWSHLLWLGLFLSSCHSVKYSSSKVRLCLLLYAHIYSVRHTCEKKKGLLD